MSLIIKGMEMPTNADMAPTAVWVYPNGYAIVFKDNGKMQQYTEAVPVPDHGRLIDADELGKVMSEGIAPSVKDGGFKHPFDIIRAVANAPTIIPADPPVMCYPQVPGITPTVIAEEGE